MSQSLAQIYVHLIFSTKNRKPFLKDINLRSRVHAYFVGVCKNLNCPSLQIGGVEDHVHILFRLGKAIELQNLIRDVKRDSSPWIKTQVPTLADFHWQAGYGAFSVSPSHIDALIRYIANQEEHHRQIS